MEEKYVVELTKQTVDEIADICELAAITLAKRQDVCALWTYYAGLLRNAQPLQPSPLQRLEEWAEQQTTGYVRIRSVWLESAEPSALLSISISPGWEVHLVPSSDEVGDVVLHRATLDLAINAALDAAEGADQ